VAAGLASADRGPDPDAEHGPFVVRKKAAVSSMIWFLRASPLMTPDAIAEAALLWLSR